MRVPTTVYGKLQQDIDNEYYSKRYNAIFGCTLTFSVMGTLIPVLGALIHGHPGSWKCAALDTLLVMGGFSVFGAGVGTLYDIPYPMQKIADLNKDEVLVSLDGLNALLKSMYEKTGLYLRKDEMGFPLVESSSPSYPVAENKDTSNVVILSSHQRLK